MATPVFKFQHPDLPGEDLYFIHNTFFDLPETLPMDLTTFIWYHLETGRTLEGFFYCWDNLNKYQTSLEGNSFQKHFDEKEKQQLYDDALFGQSLKAAQKNRKKSLNLKYFIDFKKYQTENIFDHAKPFFINELFAWNTDWDTQITFFYSRHYLFGYLWENFSEKLDDKDSYKFDKEIIKKLIAISGMGLSFASDELKKDSKLIYEAVNRDCRALHFADKSLMNDKNFVLEIVKLYGFLLEYFNDTFRKDKEVVIVALKSKKEAIEFVDESLKKDEDVLALVSANSEENYESEEDYDLPF